MTDTQDYRGNNKPLVVEHKQLRPQLYTVAGGQGSTYALSNHGAGVAPVQTYASVMQGGSFITYNRVGRMVEFEAYISLDRTQVNPISDATNEVRLSTLPPLSTEPAVWGGRLPPPAHSQSVQTFVCQGYNEADARAEDQTPVTEWSARVLSNGELALITEPLNAPLTHAGLTAEFGFSDPDAGAQLVVCIRGSYLSQMSVYS